MATNIITPSNSRSAGLSDTDAGAILLVTEGGYIFEDTSGVPAYFARGGSADITIKGSVIAAQSFGFFLVASLDTPAR